MQGAIGSNARPEAHDLLETLRREDPNATEPVLREPVFPDRNPGSGLPAER